MQSTPHALVQSSMHLDNGQDARMPVLAAALAHRRLVNDNAALRLMRADLLPVVAAVLGEYLGAPGARVSVDEMHERLSAPPFRLEVRRTSCRPKHATRCALSSNSTHRRRRSPSPDSWRSWRLCTGSLLRPTPT